MENQEHSKSAKAPVSKRKRDWLVWVLTYPQHYLEQHRAEKQKQSPADRAANSTARATWFIAFFTIAMVGVGILQWRSLHQTDETIRLQLQAMRIDQRPFIALTNNIGSPKFLPDEPNQTAYLAWNWESKNYGRGIAYRFGYRTFMAMGDERTFTPSRGQLPGPSQLSVTLPPGLTSFVTAVSGRPLRGSEAQALLNNYIPVSLLIEFNYFDMYGEQYADTFCIELLRSGAVTQRNPTSCEKRKE